LNSISLNDEAKDRDNSDSGGILCKTPKMVADTLRIAAKF
jgi:hypothetical protein